MQAIHLEDTERLEAATNKWKTRQREILVEGATVFWPVVGDDLNTGEKMANRTKLRFTNDPANISPTQHIKSQRLDKPVYAYQRSPSLVHPSRDVTKHHLHGTENL